MGYKVKSEHEGSTVHFRRGLKMVKVPKLGEATQQQLEAIAKVGHPGVIKEAKSAPKRKGKSS